MGDTAELDWMASDQDRRFSEAVRREAGRLRGFIRKRVADSADAEDVLQDVLYELWQAYLLMQPIEQAGAWMFRVARNRIADLFRKHRPVSLEQAFGPRVEDGEALGVEELLPSPDAGPQAVYARRVLLEELDAALDELPEEQREVFVAHELEGHSFKDLAALHAVNLNTLLSRKRYAVLYLRRRLEGIYREFLSMKEES